MSDTDEIAAEVGAEIECPDYWATDRQWRRRFRERFGNAPTALCSWLAQRGICEPEQISARVLADARYVDGIGAVSVRRLAAMAGIEPDGRPQSRPENAAAAALRRAARALVEAAEAMERSEGA